MRTRLRVDRISLLPDNIIENILIRLPLQDAVRTSVLSRRLRYVCSSLPQLVFDDAFCKDAVIKHHHELMITIHRVLCFHHGAILKFRLSLSQLESCSDIDPLIYFVSNNGVKDLILDIWKGEHYKLPSSFFSCVLLEHLSICCCEFRPPPEFKGFGKLVSFELQDVAMTGDVCSILISSCPLLERLTLVNTACNEHLEIVAPNLRFFQWEGSFLSITFKSTPHLETLSMHQETDEDEDEDLSDPVVLFDSLPALKFLELDNSFVKYIVVALGGGVREMLANDFTHLKTLKLFGISMGNADEVFCVISLMRNSTNLEELTIGVSPSEPAIGPSQGVLEDQDLSDISLSQLREAKMLNISGSKSELKFIELVLAISPRLERMLVKPNLLNVGYNGFKILREMIRFQRASPLAEINYSSPV